MEDYLKRLGYSIARGVPQAATGFVDLAALPFTMSGMIKPEDVFLSTDYLTQKGLLPKPEQGLLNQTTELLSSAISPAAATKGAILATGGLLADAARVSGADLTPVGAIKVPIGKDEPKDLMFVKNTGEEAIKNYSLLGGMPVPSIGVIQKDQPFDNFGNISLIGKPEKFDPKQKQNVVYSSDIYSVREPQPFMLAKKDAFEQITKDYENIEEITGTGIESRGVDRDLLKLRTKKDADGIYFKQVKEFFDYSAEAKAKFLQDKAIDLPKLERPKKVKSERQQQLLIEKADLTGDALKAFKEQLKKENQPGQTVKKYYTNSDLEKIIQDNNLTDEFENWKATEQAKYFRGDQKFFSYENPKYQREFERLSEIYNKTNDPRLRDAIDRQFENLERNRYKTAEYTAENLTKVMKKMPTIGAEDGFGTSGIGRMKAGVTKKLKSLDDIKANRGLLVTDDQIPKEKEYFDVKITDPITKQTTTSTAVTTKDKFDKQLDGIINEIYGITFRGLEPNDFENIDAINRNIIEAIDRGGTEQDFLNVFKGTRFEDAITDYGSGKSKVLDNLVSFTKNLKSAPAEYFEAKPQRTVPLTDFAGAIVPEGTSKGLLDLLKSQGIRVEKYKDASDRTKLKNKFTDQMFDLGGAGLAGLLGYQLLDDEDEISLGQIRI